MFAVIDRQFNALQLSETGPIDRVQVFHIVSFPSISLGISKLTSSWQYRIFHEDPPLCYEMTGNGSTKVAASTMYQYHVYDTVISPSAAMVKGISTR